jgi:LmbE family N-acetylglucosaminyl deacetylase
MSRRKSILFCYAHPDDEIGIISLANRYMSEEGAYTTLICTTNGDVGTVDPEHMKATPPLPISASPSSPARRRPPALMK